MDHRTLSLLSLWLLTALVGFYVVVRLASGVTELRSWSAGLVLEETQPVVRFVEEGSAAQQAGLEPGDEIFQPDGRPLKAFSDYARLRRMAEQTKVLSLLVKKRDGQFYRVEVRLLPPTISWFSLEFFHHRDGAHRPVVRRCRSGRVLAALGRRHSPVRGLFFISLSTLFGSAQSALLPPWVSIPAGLLQTIGSSAAGYLCLCFFLEFPTPTRLSQPARWLKQGYGWVTLFLGLLSVTNFTVRLASFEATHWLHTVPLVNELLSARIITLWIGLASPFGLYFDRRRTQTPEQARRLKVFTVGSAVGVIPVLLLILATYTFKLNAEDYPWLYVLPIALFPLFPLSFAYVVVRHRVLGIQQILRSGVRYLFVSRGVIVLECLVFYFLARYLVFPLVLWGHSLIGQRPTLFSLSLWMVATGSAFFGLAFFINPRLQKTIDRRFFREAYKVQQVLSDLAASVRQATNIDEMLRRVAATVDAALHVKTIGFAAPQPAWESSRNHHQWYSPDVAWLCLSLWPQHLRDC